TGLDLQLPGVRGGRADGLLHVELRLAPLPGEGAQLAQRDRELTHADHHVIAVGLPAASPDAADGLPSASRSSHADPRSCSPARMSEGGGPARADPVVATVMALGL